MGVLEKFLDLVRIDSPSDPASPTCPSTAMQLDVANHLVKVMEEMGVSNVRLQDGYVYGEIPATPGYEDRTAVGFIAHMDTAPEFNGIGVKPQVIEHYDGGPVGVRTLAVACGEEVRTLEDIYEPYLIQCGFLKRTPRGRMATAKAYRHLGLTLR